MKYITKATIVKAKAVAGYKVIKLNMRLDISVMDKILKY